MQAEEDVSEDLPEVPVPEVEVEPEIVTEEEPAVEPVPQDLPVVLEEVPSTPAKTGSAEVVIGPRAVPEAPVKTMPEVPAVEAEGVPAPPKKNRQVQAELAPPAETGLPEAEVQEESGAGTEAPQPEEVPAAVPEAEAVTPEAGVPQQPETGTEAPQPEEAPAAVSEAEAVTPEAGVPQQPETGTEAPQPEEVPAAVPEAEAVTPEAGVPQQPETGTEAPQPEEAPAAVPEAEAVTPEAEVPQTSSGLPSTDPDAVYEFHRDNFVTVYEYIRTFADEGNSEEAVRLAESIPLFLETAEAILADFNEYLPDPLSNYEKENPAAGEIRLASKVSFLENTYIPRARENLETLKSDIFFGSGERCRVACFRIRQYQVRSGRSRQDPGVRGKPKDNCSG